MSVAGEGPRRLGGGSGGQPGPVGTRLSGCCGVVVLVPVGVPGYRGCAGWPALRYPPIRPPGTGPRSA
jgi:hypothetical protein